MLTGTLSIVDLAADLGVSHTTISRVINCRPGVSERLASQIRQRMREIGYEPRAVRPGPRRREEVPGQPGRRGAVGFIQLGNEATTSLPPNLINLALAASQAAATAGYDFLFAQVSGMDSMPLWLREERVSGLMLAGYRRDERLLEYLDRFATVWLSSHPSHGGADGAARDRVLSGNHAAGKMACDYLVRRGHARVASINPLGGWQLFQTRVDAFDMAARRAGATSIRFETPSDPDEVIFELPREQIEARVAPLVEQLLAMTVAERPTGVFTADSPVAVAFYRCAQRLGLVVGRDVDVISFGQHPAFAGLPAIPASVAVPEHVRGARAVSQLIWRIKHPAESRGMEVAIDPQIVDGEIVWPPTRSRTA